MADAHWRRRPLAIQLVRHFLLQTGISAARPPFAIDGDEGPTVVSEIICYT
jgi:hypothetical protein